MAAFVFGLVLIAPDRARRRPERGCETAQGAGAAVDGIRRGGAGAELLHAVWLEFAAGVTEDPGAWRCAAADHGMEANGNSAAFGAFEVCPAAGELGLPLFRGVRLAAAAHRAAARTIAHGARARAGPSKSWRCWRRLFLAAPLARQIGGNEVSTVKRPQRRCAGVMFASVTIALVAANVWPMRPCIASSRTPGVSPVAAVGRTEEAEFDTGVQRLRFRRLSDRQRCPQTFIDGRTELFGEKFFRRPQLPPAD